jgi:hypothetical protein
VLPLHSCNACGSERSATDRHDAVKDYVEYTAPQAGGELAVTRLYTESQRELALVGTRAIFATLGLWMQQEPIGFAAGDANLQRYVGNVAPSLPAHERPFHQKYRDGAHRGQPVFRGFCGEVHSVFPPDAPPAWEG